MRLQGKTVLVTGGAKRVGRRIALAFAKKGASILLHYRSSKAEAEAASSEIQASGVECLLVQADLQDAAETLRLARSLPRPPDVLVNSASIFYKTPLGTATEKDWDAFLDTNLKAPFLLSQELGLAMKARGQGCLIHIADWSGFRPYRDYAPYCASKGGLITLAKSLARELGPQVRSNVVAPGPVLPPEDISVQEKDAVAALTALGRWGSPDDIAAAAVMMAENDFINGTVLVVDGGRSLS